MPRDANGNYTLPAGNPVVSGTVIESAWANALTSDLANEMTDSLSRSGKGGFTGPVGVVDGTSGGIPGLNFINEPTSGILRAAAGDWRLAAQSIDKLRIRSGDANLSQIWAGAANGWEDIATKQRLGVPVSGSVAMAGVNAETKVWFYSAIPAGWAAAPPDANIRTLMAGTTVQVGGVDVPNNWTANINITVAGNTENAEVAHTHPLSTTTGSSGSAGGYSLGGSATAAPANHTHSVTGTTGEPGAGTTAHNHSVSIGASGSDTYQPRYAEGLIGVIDAP